MLSNSISQAVILSAGLGTRLREVTGGAVPKVMVPILGKPLLEYHIEHFKKHGVSEFFINLFYLPEAITDFFGDGSKWGVRIHYFLEKPEIRGTAGGMKDFDGELGDNFFLVYGDMYSVVDYSKMGEAFLKNKDALGMVLVGKTDHPHDSDLLELDSDMNFKKMYPKPHESIPATRFSMLATYVFNRRILSFIPRGAYYEIDHQLIPDVLSKGEKVVGYTSDDYLLDIGTPERYRQVEEYLKNLKK